eukprot:gene8763-6164_t
MDQDLNECLRRSWEESDTARTSYLTETMDRLQARVRAALSEMESDERSRFFADLPQLEQDIASLLQRAKQFSEGVSMWRWKAQVSVEAIEEKQRALSQLVEAAAVNVRSRAEALRRHQVQATEEVEMRGEAVLQDNFHSLHSILAPPHVFCQAHLTRTLPTSLRDGDQHYTGLTPFTFVLCRPLVEIQSHHCVTKKSSPQIFIETITTAKINCELCSACGLTDKFQFTLQRVEDLIPPVGLQSVLFYLNILAFFLFSLSSFFVEAYFPCRKKDIPKRDRHDSNNTTSPPSHLLFIKPIHFEKKTTATTTTTNTLPTSRPCTFLLRMLKGRFSVGQHRGRQWAALGAGTGLRYLSHLHSAAQLSHPVPLLRRCGAIPGTRASGATASFPLPPSPLPTHAAWHSRRFFGESEGVVDHYVTLGVSPTATAEEIKAAYKKLALQYHPDRNSDPGAEEMFKTISAAYHVVGDKRRRQEYDMERRMTQSGGGGPAGSTWAYGGGQQHSHPMGGTYTYQKMTKEEAEMLFGRIFHDLDDIIRDFHHINRGQGASSSSAQLRGGFPGMGFGGPSGTTHSSTRVFVDENGNRVEEHTFTSPTGTVYRASQRSASGMGVDGAADHTGGLGGGVGNTGHPFFQRGGPGYGPSQQQVLNDILGRSGTGARPPPGEDPFEAGRPPIRVVTLTSRSLLWVVATILLAAFLLWAIISTMIWHPLLTLFIILLFLLVLITQALISVLIHITLPSSNKNNGSHNPEDLTLPPAILLSTTPPTGSAACLPINKPLSTTTRNCFASHDQPVAPARLWKYWYIPPLLFQCLRHDVSVNKLPTVTLTFLSAPLFLFLLLLVRRQASQAFQPPLLYPPLPAFIMDRVQNLENQTRAYNPAVVMLGSCFVDYVAFVDHLPQVGETMHSQSFLKGFGGKGANQAVAAGRLGADVAMVSMVGGDGDGADYVRELQKNGVNTKFVYRDAKESTGVALILVDTKTSKNEIVICPNVTHRFQAATVRERTNGYAALFPPSVKYLVCQNEIPLETTLDVIKYAHQKGVYTVFNTAPPPPAEVEIIKPYLPYVSLFCPNEVEAALITGIEVKDEATAVANIKALQALGAKDVVITLGEAGFILSEGGAAPVMGKGKKVKAVDTTGAGDCFVGSMTFFLNRGENLLAACQKANECAAVSVTRKGTQASYPHPAELPAGSSICDYHHLPRLSCDKTRVSTLRRRVPLRERPGRALRQLRYEGQEDRRPGAHHHNTNMPAKAAALRGPCRFSLPLWRALPPNCLLLLRFILWSLMMTPSPLFFFLLLLVRRQASQAFQPPLLYPPLPAFIMDRVQNLENQTRAYNPAVVMLGSCFVDYVAFVDHLPQVGETMHSQSFLKGFGGKGANQAVAAGRLGADVAMVSMVGGDGDGADYVRELQKNGVNTKFVYRDAKESTGVALILVDTKTSKNEIVICPNVTHRFQAATVRERTNGYAALFPPSVKYLVCQNEIPLETTLDVIKYAHQKGVYTVFNTAPAPTPAEVEIIKPYLPYVSLFCPNEVEAALITGIEVKDEATAVANIKALQALGAKDVVITLGEAGFILSEGGAAPVKAVDTTGAGDCFVGSMTFFLNRGENLLAACQKANECAAVSVTRKGTQASYPPPCRAPRWGDVSGTPRGVPCRALYLLPLAVPALEPDRSKSSICDYHHLPRLSCDKTFFFMSPNHMLCLSFYPLFSRRVSTLRRRVPLRERPGRALRQLRYEGQEVPYLSSTTRRCHRTGVQVHTTITQTCQPKQPLCAALVVSLCPFGEPCLPTPLKLPTPLLYPPLPAFIMDRVQNLENQTRAYNPAVVMLGSCFVDYVAFVDHLPQVGETMHSQSFLKGFGGKGANQAVAAGRLGADVAMVSMVGGDGDGADYVRELQKNGVNTKFVYRDAKESTGVALILVDTKTSKNEIVICPNVTHRFQAATVRERTNGYAALFPPSVKYLVCQNEIPLETTLDVIKYAHQKGVYTVFNTAPAPTPAEVEIIKPYLPYVSLFCPNEVEAALITGIEVKDEATAVANIKALQALGAKDVVITLGEAGFILSEGGAAPVMGKGKKVKAVDTTGAGDCFVGSMTFFLNRGENLLAACQKANECAAVSVTRKGTQASYPHPAELPAGSSICDYHHLPRLSCDKTRVSTLRRRVPLRERPGRALRQLRYEGQEVPYLSSTTRRCHRTGVQVHTTITQTCQPKQPLCAALPCLPTVCCCCASSFGLS